MKVQTGKALANILNFWSHTIP